MDPSEHAVRRIVIVGGGSAGWLTAGLLAARHAGHCDITLIESPTLPPIGVGEGTWPTMRDTLRSIGIREAELIRECDASFKQGSRFDGWVDGGAGDSYLHPFSLPQGYTECNLVPAWRQRHRTTPFAALVTPQAAVCAHGRAPKQASTPEYAAVVNYAYHFDATKFALLLRRHAVEQLGVHHVADDVVEVCAHDNGDIAAVQTQAHGRIEGDLFIDCSGHAALLLGQHCQVPFISQQAVLFCDRALALQVPYADERAPIASQTISTAQTAGWVWDIGLPTRRGVGLVYSSAHCSDDEAERMLREHLQRHGGPIDPPAPRALRFTPGHRERFWQRNCVAIGLSAGFLEPLEASALALIEYAAGFLCDQLPATRAAMDTIAERFNDGCRYRWARIIDFLKLHYVLSQRNDSDFWRDHRRRESIPDRLQALLALWRHLPPSRYDLVRHDEPFPSASYQYILYGMGFEPADDGRALRSELEAAESYFQEAASACCPRCPATAN